MRSREYECFHSNLNDLVEAAGPVVERLADQALTAGLISHLEAQDAHNDLEISYKKASSLLGILLTRVKQRSEDFYVVRRILESIPELQHTADLLQLKDQVSPPPLGEFTG